MIPTKINPLSFERTDISIFKIQGNSLQEMYVTPIKNCIVDFGNGNKQILDGTNTPTLINHTYDIEDEYTIKIIGNHSTFQASKNTIEAIQLSDTITSCYSMFYNCTNLLSILTTFCIPKNVTDCRYIFYNCKSLINIPEIFKLSISICRDFEK